MFYQVLAVLVPLVTAPYLSRVLGPDGIGTYSYTSSIVTYFVLFANFGIATYGQREISYAQDDRTRRTTAFWETKLLNFVTVAVSLVAYLIFIKNTHTYRTMFTILSLNIISVALDITWLYQGMEEFKTVVLRNTIIKILNVAFIFLCITKQSDLLLYAAGTVVFLLCGEGAMWFGLSRFVDKPQWKNLHPFRNFRSVFSLFIPTIAISIYTVLDKTMLGIITGSVRENGYYEQATKMARVCLVFVTSLATVMVPRMGFYVEKDDTEHIKEAMYQSYRFVWFLGLPICLGIIGVAENFVPWFFGPKFLKVIPLVKIMAWIIPIIGINNETGALYLIPYKRQKIYTITISFGALLNFICNSILIPRWTSIGAAIGSVIAELCIAISQLVIVRKELSLRKIASSSIHYWIAGIIMWGVLKIENNFFTPSISHTLILIISGMITYGIVLIILKDTFLTTIFANLKKHVLFSQKNSSR